MRQFLGWLRNNREQRPVVPRGGNESSPIGLKLCHFSNDDFPVYPLTYPAFRTMPQRQKLFVYVRCARFNGQSLAEAMFGELDRCPPKAKATRSNRVGCAICIKNHEHFRPLGPAPAG
jgi:hypothetical protein